MTDQAVAEQELPAPVVRSVWGRSLPWRDRPRPRGGSRGSTSRPGRRPDPGHPRGRLRRRIPRRPTAARRPSTRRLTTARGPATTRGPAPGRRRPPAGRPAATGAPPPGAPAPPDRAAAEAYVADLRRIDPAIVGAADLRTLVDRGLLQCRSIRQHPGDRPALVRETGRRFAAPGHPDGFGEAEAARILDVVRARICPAY
ncbi:hypothetical protein GCM10020358_02630 [Amorphoplanes nipponensis]|uniref:hypothetical protein n=1 Tax=Actinoplanes nipponensis TaxID=135950 RepID=UPI0031EB1A5D